MAPIARISSIRAVAGTVKDGNLQLPYWFTFGLCQGLDVIGRGVVGIDHTVPGAVRDDLVHVERRGGVEHGVAVGDGDHAQRIGPARCSETGSVYWIHSDVDAGPPPRADQFAVVQHRCSVFLSFADDNSSGDIDGGKIGTQCINRCCVGGILIAAADPPLRADRGPFP